VTVGATVGAAVGGTVTTTVAVGEDKGDAWGVARGEPPPAPPDPLTGAVGAEGVAVASGPTPGIVRTCGVFVGAPVRGGVCAGPAPDTHLNTNSTDVST
jgi:hypothetical protein